MWTDSLGTIWQQRQKSIVKEKVGVDYLITMWLLSYMQFHLKNKIKRLRPDIQCISEYKRPVMYGILSVNHHLSKLLSIVRQSVFFFYLMYVNCIGFVCMHLNTRHPIFLSVCLSVSLTNLACIACGRLNCFIWMHQLWLFWNSNYLLLIHRMCCILNRLLLTLCIRFIGIKV